MTIILEVLHVCSRVIEYDEVECETDESETRRAPSGELRVRGLRCVRGMNVRVS